MAPRPSDTWSDSITPMEGRVTVPTIFKVRAVGPVPARTESTDRPAQLLQRECAELDLVRGETRIGEDLLRLRVAEALSVDGGWLDDTVVGGQARAPESPTVDRELGEPEGRPSLMPGTVDMKWSRAPSPLPNVAGSPGREESPVAALVLDEEPQFHP